MIPRRRLFKVHNALGVGASAFLLLIAVTGVLLTFRGQFKRPRPTVSPVETALGVEALVATAEAAVGARATDVALPKTPTAPYVVWLDDAADTVVFMDGSGAIVEQRSNKGGWMRVVFGLHTGEILGVPGQALSVLSGLSLALLSMTGLAMFRRRRLARRS